MHYCPHSQKAFKVTSMRIQFEDLIYLVANYEEWLTACIDPKLSGNVTQNVNIICPNYCHNLNAYAAVE